MSFSPNDVDSAKSVTIKQAQIPNISGMAFCHTFAFPGRFMTEMGNRWLCALYRFFIKHPGGICYVAMDSAGKVAGFAVGGEPDIREQFIRTAMLRYPHIIFWKFLTRHIVRTVLLDELLKKMHLKRKEISLENIDSHETLPKCGNLLSICVLPDYKGTGIASRLIETFQKACAAAGYRCLTLSVLSENSRAMAFYKKHNWYETGVTGASTKFALDLNINQSDSDK
jgi:ribosomal protein S18 acetylase RimI-like enzyme